MSDIGQIPMEPTGGRASGSHDRPGHYAPTVRGIVPFDDLLAELSNTEPARTPASGMPPIIIGSLPSHKNRPASKLSNGQTAPAKNYEIEVGRFHYNGNKHSSGTAIAFCARAIVAPASIQYSCQYRAESSFKFDQYEKPQNIFTALSESDALLRGLDSLMALQFTRLSNRPASEGSAGQLALNVPMLTPDGRPGAAVKVVAPPLQRTNFTFGLIEHTQLSGQTARSGSSLSAKSSSVQLQTFAQLAASQSEYRVIIRGLKMSDTERDLVLRGINVALRQLGLPFQPVQIMNHYRSA